MKTTKRLITTILALSILLSVLAGITVSALELDEDVVIEDSSYEEELAPIVAMACEEYDPYPLVDGYYGSPGTSGGSMRVMSGGLTGAYSFFTFLTGQPGVIGVTTAIPGGGTARITSSISAVSGYAVQINTAIGQPFKSQRVHFN